MIQRENKRVFHQEKNELNVPSDTIEPCVSQNTLRRVSQNTRSQNRPRCAQDCARIVGSAAGRGQGHPKRFRFLNAE